MKLGDIYKSNISNSYIWVDSFITNLDPTVDNKPLYIVVNQLQIIDDCVSYSPSFNKYATQEYIDKNYTLWKATSEMSREEVREAFDELYTILLQDAPKDFEDLLKALV